VPFLIITKIHVIVTTTEFMTWYEY